MVEMMDRQTLSVKYALLKSNFQEMFISDGSTLYKWNGKFYKQFERKEEFVQFIMGVWSSKWGDWLPRRGDDLLLDYRSYFYHPREDFKIPDNWICFNNVIFDIETRETIEYNQAYLVTSVLPYDYTDDEPVMFLKTLKEIIPDDVDRDKMLSFFHQSLTPSLKKQKALICVGDGANGKTALIESVAELMGDKATAFKLTSLSGSERTKAIVDFKDKTFAHASEIGGTYINTAQMNLIKSLITDKFQSGRPAYGKSVKWINTTKFLYATNGLPKVENPDDDAFWRRFDIINFTESFYGKNCDETIFERIMKEESSAVLSYIARYKGDYDFRPDKEVIREMWLNASDITRDFLEDYDLEEITSKPQMKRVYADFKNWCDENDKKSIQQDYFKKRLMHNDVNISIPKPLYQMSAEERNDMYSDYDPENQIGKRNFKVIEPENEGDNENDTNYCQRMFLC